MLAIRPIEGDTYNKYSREFGIPNSLLYLLYVSPSIGLMASIRVPPCLTYSKISSNLFILSKDSVQIIIPSTPLSN